MHCLTIAGDPGGARALAPVVAEMRRLGWMVDALAYGEACFVWSRGGLGPHFVPESLSAAQAEALLDGSGAELLLAATSWRPEHIGVIELEKLFIGAARRLAIPSLAVMDFWSNYRQRFSDPSGRMTYIPDRIAVMDDLARDEMIAEGFAPDALVVTGQPAFEVLEATRTDFDDARRRRVRAEHGIDAGETMVLFLSQPLSAMFDARSAHGNRPGFDEQTVLRALLSALDELSERFATDRGPIHLVVLPHLREDPAWMSGLRPERVRLSLAGQDDPHGLIMAADLVTGMTSTRLVEACLLGKRPVSIQPGGGKHDPVPTNRSGLSRGVYSYGEILPAIEGEMGAEGNPESAAMSLEALRRHRGATARIIALATAMATKRMERP